LRSWPQRHAAWGRGRPTAPSSPCPPPPVSTACRILYRPKDDRKRVRQSPAPCRGGRAGEIFRNRAETLILRWFWPGTNEKGFLGATQKAFLQNVYSEEGIVLKAGVVPKTFTACHKHYYHKIPASCALAMFPRALGAPPARVQNPVPIRGRAPRRGKNLYPFRPGRSNAALCCRACRCAEAAPSALAAANRCPGF